MSHDLTTKDGLQAAVNEAGSWAKLSQTRRVSVSTLKTRALKLGVSTPETLRSAGDPVLKREIVTLRRQLKALTEGEEAAERVARRLERAIEDRDPVFERTAFAPKPSGAKTPQHGVLLYSDNHASEVVSLEETRGINEYNWNIMLSRMQGIQDAVFSHAQHFGFTLESLNIYGLGDHLSGDIHEELAITNEMPAAEAVVQLAYDTVPWLLGFAEQFEHIHIATCPGNHPRASKKPAAKQAHNNGDWLYWKMVEGLLRNDPQFSFNIPRGAFNLDMIAGRYRALLMHGDGIRSTMPGVPWGGITKRVTQLEQQFTRNREPLDYVFLGHFHTRNTLDGISAQTFTNGSIKGTDEYSIKQFGSGRDASQTFLTFHPKRGWTGSYAVELQEGRQAASEGWGPDS